MNRHARRKASKLRGQRLEAQKVSSTPVVCPRCHYMKMPGGLCRCPYPHECKARQFSDQMVCEPCGLRWDVNDPEPPACKEPR